LLEDWFFQHFFFFFFFFFFSSFLFAYWSVVTVRRRMVQMASWLLLTHSFLCAEQCKLKISSMSNDDYRMSSIRSV